MEGECAKEPLRNPISSQCLLFCKQGSRKRFRAIKQARVLEETVWKAKLLQSRTRFELGEWVCRWEKKGEKPSASFTLELVLVYCWSGHKKYDISIQGWGAGEGNKPFSITWNILFSAPLCLMYSFGRNSFRLEKKQKPLLTKMLSPFTCSEALQFGGGRCSLIWLLVSCPLPFF